MKKTMAAIGGAVLFMFLGLIYAWSIFAAPLESEFGWTRDQTSLTFTICMSLFCIGGLVAAQLRKKLNVNVILLLNAVVILTAFILTSKLTSLWQLYVFYGVLCGFSVGSAYNCILSVVPLHFPKKIGLINGTMLFFYGTGGLVLGAVAKNLINRFDWRTAFVYLGILFLIVFLALSFFVRPPKLKSEYGKKEVLQSETGLTPKEMIKQPYFYLFFIWQIFINAMGLALIGHSASIANEIHISGSLLAIAAGTASAASGVGKFLFGLLYDLKGRVVTMNCASVIGLIGALILYFCLKTNSVPLLLIGYFCCGASFGAAPACNATFTRKQFGDKYFSMNFGINSMSLLVSAFLGTYLVGIVRTSSSSYLSSIIILGAFMLAAIVVVQFMRKEN